VAGQQRGVAGPQRYPIRQRYNRTAANSEPNLQAGGLVYWQK
jgi:hypothetical protein